jgi:hypothetical protein
MTPNEQTPDHGNKRPPALHDALTRLLDLLALWVAQSLDENQAQSQQTATEKAMKSTAHEVTDEGSASGAQRSNP